MGDAGSVPQGDALEDFALSEDVRQRAEEPLDRPVEALRVFAEKGEPKDAPIEYEARRRERPRAKGVHREPNRNDAEQIAWRNHVANLSR